MCVAVVYFTVRYHRCLEFSFYLRLLKSTVAYTEFTSAAKVEGNADMRMDCFSKCWVPVPVVDREL